MDQNTLQHFGVLGMKWGIRRNQSRLSSRRTKKPTSMEYKQSRKLRRKGSDAMTNKELKTYIERMNLEQQYRNLNANAVSNGRKFASKTLNRIGDRILDKVIGAAIDIGTEQIKRRTGVGGQ